MKKLRIGINITIFIICAYLFRETFQFNNSLNQQGVGPSFFPRVLLAIIMLLTFIEIFTSLKMRKEAIPITSSGKRLTLFALTFLVFISLFNTLPFLVISVGFLFIMGIILKIKLLPSLLFSIILSISVYYIFTQGFNIIL
ncbi:tripartite tricarboxylate transporter TctB family protein [Halobacillus sp. Marseille-P3879]|uniref:tripartite tricarboxylate transporter TctB family protein n=1 Tax=Halobacillus sp. Marseille-P3879 TaxID=2045014 RepID=UPI000C7B15AB|nr:tripartite tricarboxylate transporter TctB family protein [Halobacillus sp. Marseille-P3879]